LELFAQELHFERTDEICHLLGGGLWGGSSVANQSHFYVKFSLGAANG